MDALIAGEIARFHVETLREEADRWRRQSRAARLEEARRRSPGRSIVPEPDRWRLWRLAEPDPGSYGRSG